MSAKESTARSIRLTPKGVKVVRRDAARRAAEALLRDVLDRDVLSLQARALVEERWTEIALEGGR